MTASQTSIAKRPRYLCRVCNTLLDRSVAKLAAMPLTDDFIRTDTPGRQEYIRDIEIFECSHCGIVQNPADFDHEGYYQDYQYSSAHSSFTKRFMGAYAEVTYKLFSEVNGRAPLSVLEVGSGDGAQLSQFLKYGIQKLKGIEPSQYLADIANGGGIPTHVSLFDAQSPAKEVGHYDICLSSYTFDHVRNPREYLAAAHALLNTGGILAFEVHDLKEIITRTEYCLFEHEHTIYLTSEDAVRLLECCGFQVVSINPIPSSVSRGNSLIVIARKIDAKPGMQLMTPTAANTKLLHLDVRIQRTIQRIDEWVDALPAGATLVGFGAGGRGVMTLAALSQAHRFAALFDSNYRSGVHMAPKTRIPIEGPEDWSKRAQSYCLVFSFGYFEEIKNQLIGCNFKPERIVSLLDFYKASAGTA
jgi:SAM-dependent methyltransferase